MNQYSMKTLTDEKIIDSWGKNVEPWINAIEQHEIDSRIETTNNSILAEIINLNPSKVLDLGCGEGWLTNELACINIDALGIDAIPDFIKYAEGNKKGRFKVMSYEELSRGLLKEKFDLVVCNFSLLGENSVQQVFKVIPSLLRKRGSFIVQTIHPMVESNTGNYIDGWRKGNWNGFNSKFTDPAPWYYRTLSSWFNLFIENEFNITSISEPQNKNTNTISSIIIAGKKK